MTFAIQPALTAQRDDVRINVITANTATTPPPPPPLLLLLLLVLNLILLRVLVTDDTDTIATNATCVTNVAIATPIKYWHCH